MAPTRGFGAVNNHSALAASKRALSRRREFLEVKQKMERERRCLYPEQERWRVEPD
jgi:hypothetical protein